MDISLSLYLTVWSEKAMQTQREDISLLFLTRCPHGSTFFEKIRCLSHLLYCFPHDNSNSLWRVLHQQFSIKLKGFSTLFAGNVISCAQTTCKIHKITSPANNVFYVDIVFYSLAKISLLFSRRLETLRGIEPRPVACQATAYIT